MIAVLDSVSNSRLKSTISKEDYSYQELWKHIFSEKQQNKWSTYQTLSKPFDILSVSVWVAHDMIKPQQ